MLCMHSYDVSFEICRRCIHERQLYQQMTPRDQSPRNLPATRDRPSLSIDGDTRGGEETEETTGNFPGFGQPRNPYEASASDVAANSDGSYLHAASQALEQADLEDRPFEETYSYISAITRLQEQPIDYGQIPGRHEENAGIDSVDTSLWDRSPIGDNVSITNSSWTTIDLGNLPVYQTLRDEVRFLWDLGYGISSQSHMFSIPRWQLQDLEGQNDDADDDDDPDEEQRRRSARAIHRCLWARTDRSHAHTQERQQICEQIDQLLAQNQQPIQFTYDSTLDLDDDSA